MGKKVYAVPGPINSAVSLGTNELIKSGNAIMATEPKDIIKIRSSSASSTSLRATVDKPKMNILELEIYKVLQIEPLDIDEIAAKIGGSVVEVGSTLSVMSLKGLLTESGGKYYLSNTC